MSSRNTMVGVDVDVLRGLDGLGVCALGVPNKEGLT